MWQVVWLAAGENVEDNSKETPEAVRFAMLRRPIIACFLLLLACSGLLAVARAEDVLDRVPRDALCVVVVRNLEAVDAKVRGLKLLPDASNPLSPALLKSVAGPNSGIGARGDFLLVALASEGPLEASPLCLWLPVTDYDRFARSLGGDPTQRITVITVLGETCFTALKASGPW